LLDPTKVTVNVARLGITGFMAADFLRQRKIAVELADDANILFLITYADSLAAIDAAVKALSELSRTKRKAKGAPSGAWPTPPPPGELVLTPREAFYAKREDVPLAEAAGRVAARDITFYPPGVPLVLPGEIITKEIAEYARIKAAARREKLPARIGVVC
jgi:arginine/lysine/ornithine decarboxylase